MPGEARRVPPPVRGVDGVRGGWVAAATDGDDVVTWTVSASFLPLLDSADAVVAVDIPIGLTTGDRRTCDRQARRLLPGRASSVFPAPTLATAADRREGVDHAEAVRRARDRGHPAPSIEAWNITDKITDVADALAAAAATTVVECHPEVTFARIAGRVLDRKKTAAGVGQRIAALAGHLDAVSALATVPAGVPVDDALDALACLVTARRVRDGTAEPLGDPDQHDPSGRPLLIWV